MGFPPHVMDCSGMFPWIPRQWERTLVHVVSITSQGSGQLSSLCEDAGDMEPGGRRYCWRERLSRSGWSRSSKSGIVKHWISLIDSYRYMRLFGAKPLSKPIRAYCQFDHGEQVFREIQIKVGQFFIQGNWSQNVGCKTAAISSRPQCVHFYPSFLTLTHRHTHTMWWWYINDNFKTDVEYCSGDLINILSMTIFWWTSIFSTYFDCCLLSSIIGLICWASMILSWHLIKCHCFITRLPLIIRPWSILPRWRIHININLHMICWLLDQGASQKCVWALDSKSSWILTLYAMSFLNVQAQHM